MASLDLRSIDLGTKNVLTFQTKKAAKSFQMPHLCFLMEAANRFWVFYVVARKSQNGDFHIMTKDEFTAVQYTLDNRIEFFSNITMLNG